MKDWKDRRVALTGATGFIGSGLRLTLEALGAQVDPLYGDIRDAATWDRINHNHDFVFHFAAPSSQLLFDQRPFNSGETTLLGFMHAQSAATRAGARLVYPSTGLLSQGRSNEYARTKQVCEDLARGTDSLGIRVFAGYGPGEARKGTYASVVTLFAQDILDGRRPVVWGDGEQTRDFIFIDDIVDGVLLLADECRDPVVDLGSGISWSFNRVVQFIADEIGVDAQPDYRPAPPGYVLETSADTSLFEPRFSMAEGVEATVAALR